MNRTDLVIEQSTHDPFISVLSRMFPTAQEGRKCCRWDQFLRFALFHLYLYALALPECGLDVCVDRLAAEPRYRSDTEEKIAAATGLSIDLAGCRESIELSTLSFDGRQQEALETIRIIAGAIPAFLPSWSNHQQHFVDEQIRALEEEVDRYVFYTQATIQYASAGFADLAAAREAALCRTEAVQQRDQLVLQIADLQARVADLAEACEELRKRARTNDGAAARFEQLAKQSWADTAQSSATIEELRTEIRLLQSKLTACEEWKCAHLADISRLRAALTAVHMSTSWQLTAPLRALKRLALRAR